MKKQSGFTLIELMVVLAIIALLAVAGLAAYVGYVKKARDTARMSDLSIINKALLTVLTEQGKSPTDIDDVVAAIEGVNNGVLATDPQGISDVCQPAGTGTGTEECGYRYIQCDNGAGFAVSARFEAKVNQSKYTVDGIDAVDNFGGSGVTSAEDSYWSLGSCSAICGSATTDCVLIGQTLIAPTTP